MLAFTTNDQDPLMNQQAKVYLAVDLGASSGRVVAGLFDGARLQLEEVHRFENGGVTANDRLYWDVLAQWQHIKNGLRAAAARYGQRIVSIGVDTWGVDFALLGEHDELLGNPFHYRDRHTEGVMERAIATAGREWLFGETGLQFLPFNTLYQLLALHDAKSPNLAAARAFLMMPDLFHWLMTGVKVNEFTNATTTQFYNPVQGNWAHDVLAKFDLPSSIMCRIEPPGTRLGPLRAQVAAETGLHNVDVVLPGTHDTASAVMAVPARSSATGAPDWCYLSSGTWSLMGAEVRRPVINELCAARNFTNEGGVGGTVRLLKNIAGLWLIQECRRIWKLAGQDYNWTDLMQKAQAAPQGRSLIDPDHSRFLAPPDMPAEIRAACQETGQPVPADEGAVIRCALDSLALRYRSVLGWTEQLIGNAVQTLHIVGGGVQNTLLSQMTADACRRRVLGGPIEATAVGNVMMQAVAAGDVAGISEAREIVGSSFPVSEFEPQAAADWDERAARFEDIVARQAQT